jgi:hypothetical protein
MAFRSLVALCPLAVLLPAVLQGQATGTAYQGIRLYTYGMGYYVRPDYGGALKNAGATVGGTANVYTLYPFELGVDLRAVGSGGRVSKEYFFGGGPRVQVDLGRFEPFAQFHVGYGRIAFQYVTTPGYTHDQSLVKAYGGGLDYRLSRSWAVRGEVERQSWFFSGYTYSFYPLAVSAGVRYQFHFHNRLGPE